MFDPEKKPRLPQGVENALREREAYFDPRIGQDEDGFTLQDAESLGWNVGLDHASKPFPGRGQVEVRSYEFGEGRYGVLKEIYEYELKEHQRASTSRLRKGWSASRRWGFTKDSDIPGRAARHSRARGRKR